VRVAVDEALLLWAASRRRAKLPIPQWLYQVMAVGRLVSIVVKSIYDEQIRRFWTEIRHDWRANERLLAKDPRNGQIR
jgi:hypothetical protein